MVKAAKFAYENYPTVVNDVPESGLTYDNTMAEYTKMDSMMQSAQKAIGGSSDSAQLCQSYMWTKIAHGLYDDEYWQLYHNTVILAVLAQISIDGCKKVFSVDPNDDIKRIRSQACMQREKDFPKFMKYTHEIPLTKNGKERPYSEVKKDKNKINARIDDSIVCPMNWLQERLEKIQGTPRDNLIETHSYLIRKPDGKPKATQMSKIRKVIEEYDAFTKLYTPLYYDNDNLDPLIEKTKEIIDIISGMKISTATIYRLIETSLGLEGSTNTDKIYKNATKYTRKMMNILFKTNREKFLNCFTKSVSVQKIDIAKTQ